MWGTASKCIRKKDKRYKPPQMLSFCTRTSICYMNAMYMYAPSVVDTIFLWRQRSKVPLTE